MTWVGIDRPGYGDSTRLRGRNPADVANDCTAVADAWGVERYAVVGYSGGGPHALACAAADARVTWAITVASLAPREGAGSEWYTGMIDSGVAALTAAEAGEDARRDQGGEPYDPEFLDVDLAALGGELGWLGGGDDGADGAIDDDLAYVRPWGVDLARIKCPVTVVHGTADRIVPVSHGRRLAALIDTARLIEMPDHGHVSVLSTLPSMLAAAADRRSSR